MLNGFERCMRGLFINYVTYVSQFTQLGRIAAAWSLPWRPYRAPMPMGGSTKVATGSEGTEYQLATWDGAPGPGRTGELSIEEIGVSSTIDIKILVIVDLDI